MDASSIAVLVSAVLSVISLFLGAKYQQAKNKARQLSDLLNKIVDAAQDDRVTEAEFQEIVSSAQKLIGSEG